MRQLQNAIEQSAQLSDFLQVSLSTKATVNVRGRLAMAYLCMCLDHREAILLLVDCGAYASAAALQRPLLEAFVSGAWLCETAAEEEVRRIAALQMPVPKFESMTQRLRKTHALGKWFEVLRGHYGILGDYAHGHQRQLSRWLDRNEVAPRYEEDHLIEILRHSDIVGLLAAVHREKIADRPTGKLLEIIDAAMQQRLYAATFDRKTAD